MSNDDNQPTESHSTDPKEVGRIGARDIEGYQLTQKIGSGTTGAVYRAVQISM